MALSVTHSFTSAIADDPIAAAAGEVLPQTHWNAGHILVFTGAAGGVLFNNAGTLTADAGLTYSATGQILTGPGAVWNTTNPNVNSVASDLAGMRINTTFDIGVLAVSSPNFGNATALEIVQNSNVGQNVFGGGTNAKKTLASVNFHHISPAAGQRYVELLTGDYYGMGDAFLASHQVNYAGGPGAGDEGQGFNAVSYLKQPDAIVTFTISALPTKSTLSTTTTQAITGSQNVQTVTVTSSTGAVVGDWIIVEQAPNSGTDNLEAVQITAVAAGTISGRFINNHLTGVTITPALLITPSSTLALGEQRLLVNTSTATTYATGTITAISGANMTGSGTAWTAAIVGGTATNIGAIALASDDVTATPFNTTTNRLKTWSPIISMPSGTSLNVHSYSVTGDVSYKGKGVGGGPTAYIIRPGARIMMIVGSLLVCETSAHTWTIGDTLECTICPWADVSGYQWHFGAYANGGTFRSFMDIQNTGFRTFANGINIGGGGQQSGINGTDNSPFGNAINAYGNSVGVHITGSLTAAISLDSTTVNSSQIQWTPSGHTIQDTATGFTLTAPSISGVGGSNAIYSPILNLSETWNGAAIATTGASGAAALATITFAAQPVAFPVGSTIVVAGITPTGYNGTYAVVSSTTTSVSYTNVTTGPQTVAGTVQQAFGGIKLNITNTASAAGSLLIDLQVGGVSQFKVDKAGVITGANFTATAQGLVPLSGGGTTNFLRADGTWATTSASIAPLVLTSANNVDQYNGLNAQLFRVYNTRTDAANGEWLELNWSGNTMFLRTQANGTGSQRGMNIAADGTLLLASTASFLQMTPAGGTTYFVASDAILPGSDNAINVGRAGSRFRIAFLGTYTVGTLPAAGATLQGARTTVTDATTSTFMGTLTGGGTTVVPVFCNGTAWLIG